MHACIHKFEILFYVQVDRIENEMIGAAIQEAAGMYIDVPEPKNQDEQEQLSQTVRYVWLYFLS